MNKQKVFIVLIIGIALGAITSTLFSSFNQNDNHDMATKEKQPLYWVAPMDSNYRRDKPGKSPMGMDLIPVYEEDEAGGNDDAGTVTISPNVVNNLGVRTAEVELNALHTEITTVGYVQYDQDKLIHIHPRVDGWVETLFVKASGDPVEQGQPLYTLYSPQLVNAQEELLIALNRNNKTLIAGAKERLLALQLSEEFIQNLINTKQVQQNITFFARQSGVVAELNIREGFYVKPGNTLMSIGSLEHVWVEAEVFERDVALIKPGLKVTMNLDYLPETKWRGVVDYVYPTLDSTTRTLRVRLKFANHNSLLKPNMFAQISIHAEPRHESVIVPREAVIRTGQQDRVVLALEQGKFKSISVQIGRVESDYIEILSGLEQGDRIVTSAQFLIDSESSKNSDFKRMSEQDVPITVWMQGSVNSVEPTENVVNISHAEVPEWQWPEMTMNFALAKSVNIDQLKAGQELHFEVSKQDDQYLVSAIHIISEPQQQNELPQATVLGVINSIDVGSRVLNISREGIEKWQRPPATMDFVAAENIDLSKLQQGQKIEFTFEVADDLVIIKLAPHKNDMHSGH